MKKRVMFYCQHVLGMGHFIRSTEIVRGLAGFDVYFLNGGEIIPGFDLPPAVEVIDLPPVKTDAEFSDIYAVDGSMSLDQIKMIRRRRLLEEYERIEPDLLVIESFPFGRLKFAFELIPLLERASARDAEGAAYGRAKVVCSLRDILVTKREQQQFEREACRIANRYFDLLLVHSDPSFQRLDETFPRVTDLTCAVRYTGFVAQPVDRVEPVSAGELWHNAGGEATILVSIGGGRVGSELIDCAIEASELMAGRLPHRMLIFTGPYLPEPEYRRLRSKVEGRANLMLRRYTGEFISYLKMADISVSMAGYNTCLNIIATGARAIVYPFIGNNNREQTIRANKLRELGLVEVVDPQDLRPELLAEKIALMLSRPKPAAGRPILDLSGVEKTAFALAELAAAGRSGSGPEVGL